MFDDCMRKDRSTAAQLALVFDPQDRAIRKLFPR
jgi:hypothetical protein